MEISRKGISIYNITPLESSFISKKIGDICEFQLRFNHHKYIDLKIGDSCVIDGEEFYLTELPSISKENSGNFTYQCKLATISKDLTNYLYLFIDQNAEQTTTYSGKSYFPLTATLEEFISLLCRNLNRNYNENVFEFEIKSNVDLAQNKTIEFSGSNCLQALETICETFSVEWQIKGYKIYIDKEIKYNTNIVLSYPESIISPIKINYDFKNFANRLFVIGGSQNLPPTYGENLHLPNGMEYIETNRYNDNNIVEKSVKYDDIYPHRKGVVTDVTFQNERCLIADDSLDFNIKDFLLDGTSAKITFTSGVLIDTEFEISDYYHATKQIKIKRTEADGVFSPSPTLSPKVGDTYILTDISMPETYIYNAEKELLEKAQEEIKKFDVKIDCDIELNEGYLFKNKINLDLFQLVEIKDDDLVVNEKLRITEIKKYPFSILGKRNEITLSNYAPKSNFKTLINRLDNTAKQTARSLNNVKRNITSSNLDIKYNTELNFWEE